MSRSPDSCVTLASFLHCFLQSRARSFRRRNALFSLDDVEAVCRKVLQNFGLPGWPADIYSVYLVGVVQTKMEAQVAV
jgi:hypothetical protein